MISKPINFWEEKFGFLESECHEKLKFYDKRLDIPLNFSLF